MKVKKPTFSMAQVTPLVQAVFDAMFQDQIDQANQELSEARRK